MTDLICIVCPRGCHLTVDEKNQSVTGNGCKRGEIYGISEVTNPTRTVTSTVWIEQGTVPRIPVKTSAPIPKRKIFDVMKEINRLRVVAPIKSGQILIPNILDLNANVIATRTVDRQKD